MRFARRSGTTVLLNGQAADELLGGYPDYYSSTRSSCSVR